jgi:hypothetical protein
VAGNGPGVRLEVADVLRWHGDAYRLAHARHLGRVEHRVMSAIVACRTAALGGHVEACDDCGVARVAYNSCRNRHCPKCQGSKQLEWVHQRLMELLPIPYFHQVFTLPPLLNPLALWNKALIYDIFFNAAAETLKAFASDPKFLNAKLGFIGIMHTCPVELLENESKML